MPDDEKKVTEQEVETIIDPDKDENAEVSNAFDEEDDQGAEKVPEEKEEEIELKKEEAKEKEPDKKKEEPKTAKELLDERLATVNEQGMVVEEAEEEPETPPEKKPAESKGKAAPVLIADGDLPDTVMVDGEEFDLKGYLESYPDEKAATIAIATAIAKKIVEGAGYVKPEQVQALSGTVNQLLFDRNVATAADDEGNLKHPDYHSIVYGAGKKDFHAWLSKQSKKEQSAASTLDAELAVMVLDHYKEDTAKGKVKDIKNKAKDRKDKFDSLNDDTTGKTTNRRSSSPKGKAAASIDEQDDEARAAFEEDD
uniref:Uncharacterized protein n=1 Tax=viral metagenome TaxID=1070528 RepID=A0A6M3IPK9_9ZZZZ